MPARQRRMNLIAYLKTGPTSNHPGGWRHPQAALHDIFEPSRYEHLARVLEAARFDGGFFADTFGLPDMHKGGYETYLGMGGQITYVDPMAVLPLMARVTTHLGLGPTLSTTFNTPYWLARSLASLDLISKGRICWNVVTSATEMEARNFGTDALPPKDQRYDRADEVLEACCALWDCWEPDALVLDRESGRFADPSKVHRANYDGRYVRTMGPLSMPRSPQGRPVFLQAGASERGRDFAARWAEAVFCSPYGKADAQAFYADVKGRLARYGRPEDDCAILPSIAVVLGETESIAREKADYLDSLVQTELVLATNSQMLGVDLSVHQQEDAVRTAAGNQGIQGSHDRVVQVAKAEGLSFAQAARRRRNLLIGTGAQVADQLEDWFTDGAADGFIVWATVFPAMYEEFGRLVVPELQRRGLLRTEYRGATLRENLRNP
ncbi:MAG TPA: LLM class flavin-dependent oxidoreductase [Rhodopila sp.]|uniref:LLM class flavin-dependent oxidoreductase n=1 Tax=Rhodopila sp. TaxID=2480087 RepID=UPI002B56D88C|nr:LLM class flavin-dependent oxidoreductase [Rhodopila sp.]HVY14344.1 LLM class flavin-dependent oxidoreductase [Rhodopila sp.]